MNPPQPGPQQINLAVITGATSGIGAEFARQLAATHQTLWLIGRREEKLKQLAAGLQEKHGADPVVMIKDLSDPAVIDDLAVKIRNQPRLSFLVNNAGYAEDGVFHEMDWQKHDDIMHVHVQATLKLSHAALNVMAANGSGSIINVSSIAAFVPTPSSPLYGPTKAFVRSLSESLAIIYDGSGIRIQALCPGYTITDFHERLGLDPDTFYRKSGLMRAWTSEYTVKQSLTDLRQGKIVSVPGWNYRLLLMLLRRLPMTWLHKRAARGDKSHRPEQE